MGLIPQAAKGLTCPLHKKDMSKVCHTCPFWTQIRGTNPNTADPIDTWQCAIAWLPILLIENAQQTRQAGAATESLRNIMVSGIATSLQNKQEQVTHAIDDHQG